MEFDIDEAIDDQNWKKESSVSLRFTSENDLDEIFNLIQTVGKEMECKDNELFAYSKNPATYLQMLKTGICAVAVRNNRIIASLLTRPEDNRDGVFDLTGISEEFMPNTIEFVTCQVLEEYRGNKLEQKLIDFVLTTLNKLACYKYAICTISPDNAASLKSVENNGFRVCNTAKLYGGKMRYVLMNELGMNIDEPTKKFENISGNALIKDLQNKYVFWDIDGTLAPYRFNNHVADPDGTNNGMSIQEIEKGIFLARKPSRFMRDRCDVCPWDDIHFVVMVFAPSSFNCNNIKAFLIIAANKFSVSNVKLQCPAIKTITLIINSAINFHEVIVGTRNNNKAILFGNGEVFLCELWPVIFTPIKLLGKFF